MPFKFELDTCECGQELKRLISGSGSWIHSNTLDWRCNTFATPTGRGKGYR